MTRSNKKITLKFIYFYLFAQNNIGNFFTILCSRKCLCNMSTKLRQINNWFIPKRIKLSPENCLYPWKIVAEHLHVFFNFILELKIVLALIEKLNITKKASVLK